ncbi:hypothetical protein GCM10009557_89410 [Virgisporangium ochraceum]
MTGPLVVPVGRYLGMLPVGAGLRHVVRVGGRRVELADDEQLVWALAHGVPGAPDLGGWDRAALMRHLPGEAGADATIDRLVAGGLLLEVAGPVEEFARSVRLLPQALGLGNDPVEGRRFRLGHPGAALVAVPAEIFFLWSWAGLDDNLWTACVRGAKTALPDGSGDPRALATTILGALHQLLSTNAACLDAAPA